MHFIKRHFLLILLLFLISGSKNKFNSYTTNQYNIVVNHPGEKEPVDILIHQVLDNEGIPIEYYMDVPSVICLEKVCKVIPVRIFWDNLGEYQKYELEKNATLEKYKAELFEPKDYSKLQRILSDNDSPFKEVYYDEILTAPTTLEEDVDAISGETILELDDKDTVPGAALGCYTLWHWANGEIVEKIKYLTGKILSEKQLERALIDKNRDYYFIGIKELESRKNFTQSFIDIMISQVLVDENLLKSTFEYLEKSAPKAYFNAAKYIFIKGEKQQKLAAIRSLRYSKYKPKSLYLDVLSDEISSLKSFQEVSLFLDLMETKNPNSKNVIENVFQLLESDFIKARRGYWFLKNKKITSSQDKILKKFYKKNKNSL